MAAMTASMPPALATSTWLPAFRGAEHPPQHPCCRAPHTLSPAPPHSHDWRVRATIFKFLAFPILYSIPPGARRRDARNVEKGKEVGDEGRRQRGRGEAQRYGKEQEKRNRREPERRERREEGEEKEVTDRGRARRTGGQKDRDRRREKRKRLRKSRARLKVREIGGRGRERETRELERDEWG